ncbi:hypothetical protein L596_017887 [Steinernema carpocapsae]|uniref:Uncharacterized protein n=1 Tax=Steinernema carpocapsae TaxID=34508 RepID=A0A4U5N3F7_STECR|nr:hypothetical protein L596_017887 [Steinernema carpocapsae]
MAAAAADCDSFERAENPESRRFLLFFRSPSTSSKCGFNRRLFNPSNSNPCFRSRSRSRSRSPIRRSRSRSASPPSEKRRESASPERREGSPPPAVEGNGKREERSRSPSRSFSRSRTHSRSKSASKSP